ncbi:MAG: ATP cone domain-containing protein, partial [Patescibacteria group bacterium]
MAYLKTLKSIRRRDGHIDRFQPEKVRSSIREAFRSAGFDPEKNASSIDRAVNYVIHKLNQRFDGHTVPTTEDVRETAGAALIDLNFTQVARLYLLYRLQLSERSQEPDYGHGIKVHRFFTTEDSHPYDELEWDQRDAVIANEKGKVVFEQKGVEVPKFYSQTATNIIVSKYFRGRLGTPERETSMRQLVDRVAKTITNWGRVGGYFQTAQDADIYEAELTSVLVNQKAAFNSPVW